MSKTAIISGVSGQDGSLIAEQLIAKGYKVYGIIRRHSQGDVGCAEEIKDDPSLEIVEGDITDLTSMLSICKKAKADVFYSMAAQSHVGTSFEQPILTAQTTGLGVLNCLEAIRQSGIYTKFVQASSSEMFGGLNSEPITELTPFHPRSPYGCSKMFAYWIVINYRESYKMFAANSICFNHEAPGKRGPNFVTRKITLGIADIKAGRKDKLFLGNLNAKRDWMSAWDACRGIIMIGEAAWPGDYILCSGETHSVKEFCDIAFTHAGLGDYKNYVEIDPKFYRPAEVNCLLGDHSKITNELGWKPEMKFEDLVKQMVDWDLRNGK